MSSKGHNKKRNVGLVYEFLIRLISEALVEGNQDKSSCALQILKRYFKPGTELYKEFRLVHSLMKVEVSTSSVASSILTEAKSAARSHDQRQLEREKSFLIREINHKIADSAFWDQPIFEYKMYATIQTLINDWRSGVEAPLDRVAEYEDRLVRWLTESRKKPEVQEELAGTAGENRLLFKLMMKKLNEKYNYVLTPAQRSVLREYVFVASGKNSETLKQRLLEIRSNAMQSIDNYINELGTENPNKYMTSKLLEARQLLEIEKLDEITDSTVAKFMLFMKLVSELETKE